VALYGLVRYLVATDRGELILGLVAVAAVALVTQSEAITLVAAGIAVALLLGLRQLNRA
jgi:hypothetical protein